MSAEENKPAPAETTAAEPAPATETPAPAAEATKPTEEAAATTEAKAEEAKPSEASAPAEEKKEKKIEPVTEGTLGYKASGFPKGFLFSKKFFWLGDEAIPTEKLSSYLRGEKPEVAHPTAAWSSQTGKGLLYFVKHAADKGTPSGVLNLADATDLGKDGTVDFSFKANGHKHTFQAPTSVTRDGWFLSIDAAIKEAAAAKEGIVGSEGYKEVKEKLGKPLPAPAAKAEASAAKKSTEAKPEEAVTRDNASSSSSSSGEGKKKKKSKSKSRSVSRGKRASIFGSLLGKKEEKAEEKKEEKKEEKVEEKKEEEPATAGTAAPADAPTEAAAATTAPVEEAKPAEEAKPTEAVAESSEAKKEEAPGPKPVKRGSIFGNFVEKLRSPTHEKKEPELPPAVPPKEDETPAPAIETTEAAPTTEATEATADKPAETKPAEEKATTPHKEKEHFSFGKFLGKKEEKVKSPTTEAPPTEPKKEEAKEEPAAAEAEPSTGVTATATGGTPEAKKEKRSSFFGNLTGSVKKEKKPEEGETTDGEHKHKGLGGLFRNPSKILKNKEKKDTTTPPKVEEETQAKDEEAKPAEAAPATTEPAPATEAAPAPAPEASTANQNSIGDVVPDAVTVGQAQKTTPAVHAAA